MISIVPVLVLLLIFPGDLRAVSFPRLIVLNQTTQIGMLSVGDDKRRNYTVIVGQLEGCMAMDVLLSDGYVFYTNSQDNLVRVNIVGNQEPRIIEHMVFPTPGSISVEWITRKVYWYDSETSRIEVVNVDHLPPVRKVLISKNLHSVLGLVVDSLNSYMFFHNFANQHSIERAWLDGSHRVTVVDSNLSLPKSLTVDSVNRRLYWIDSERKAILSSDLDGGQRRLVVKNVKTPFVLAIYERQLFWSDIFDAGIFWAQENGTRPEHFNFFDLKPYSIRVYEPQSQPYRRNECHDNGGCSHFCFLIPVPPYKACGCRTGVKLTSDGFACRDGPEELLIVARGADIRLLSLDTPDYSDSVLNVKGVRHAVAVDYDPVERFVYWSDNELKMIRRAKLDGSEEGDVIQNELGICDGIAIDSVARNIYWTDDGADRIEVSRLDGSARRVLISSGLSHPRAIAVDPSRGYLFWSDWDDTFPKIERSYLDGSNRQVLIEFSSKRWPNGVAVDIEAGRVYWAEATSATIESADMETGQNRRVVLSGSFGHIYGFSLLGDNVYWSDRDRRFLGRANKASGDEVNEVHEQMADVRGIKATHTFRLPNYTNECGVNNGNCSHLCLYLPTGRVCMCPVGWELARDGRKCNVPEAFLMFTERGNNDILRVSLSNSRGNLDGLRLMNVTQPIALDYLYSSHKVYWTARQTDNHGGTINRAFMNGSSIERVVQGGIEHPEGLAIDWLAENIYWSDSGNHLIEMADFSGKRRRIIVWKNTHPRALAVHPTAGYLYWADWLNPWRLERSELDGNNRITLLNEVARIFSMTIDLTSGCLFWSQDGPSSIQSINLSSGSRRVIIGERSLQPYVIAEYADRLYWTSWRSHKIESCDKDTGTNRSVLSINPHYIINLVIVHALKQKGWNHCVIKRRQCQSLYVSAPENHCRCACPTHYSLGSDKKSCLPPNTFMLFTQGMGIRRMKIRDRHDTEDHPVMLFPFGEQLNPRSVQYDSYNRTIYWLASTHDSGGYSTVLRRARDDGVNVEDVTLSRIMSEEPYDIAFEPFSRTLFWSCEATSSINATRLIGGEVRPLGAIVADTEFNPRALTVYAKRRFLFFANFGYRTGIVLCQLDGSLCHFVVADNIMRPEALVFDAHGSRVFWVDSGYKQVSSVDYKGRGRQTIIYNVDYPTGVAVFRQSLYFVDQGVHKIEAVHKQAGTGREAIVERMTGLASVLAVDDELNAAELRRSPCLRKVCSHLCLLTNNGTGTYEAICACPSTMVFQSDTGRCVPKIRCNSWEWSCQDGRQCIDRAARCDGVVHCRDGSDESPVCFRCQPNEFECIEEQKCIPRLSYCDGKKDCQDGSDEHCYCPDPANQFYCSDPAGSQSKICIIRAWVCDGVRHCDDGSDESVCAGTQPSPKLGYELRFPTQDPVTYVIVIIVGFGFSAIILLAMYFFCRRPNAPTVQPVEIELVNRTLAPENGSTSALSATVECRYRLGIGKRDSLPNELYQGRAEMTGRTLSSASEDTGIRIGLYVPPPSPVSAGSFTWCSRKSQRRSGSARQGRCVRLYVQQSSAVLGMGYNGLTASYAKNDTPPPPYTCYSSTLDEGGQSTEDEVGVRIPLIMARENPAPPPPSPRSSGSVASSGPMVGRRQESCSSSSVGNGNRKKSMAMRLMENPRNPPPSPDEASDASESR